MALIYLVGDEKANHVNIMLQCATHHDIFNSLKGDIWKSVKQINRRKLVWAGFHSISTYTPVFTSFQVHIEIYEDKLIQSGDMVLYSHITKLKTNSL